MNCQKILMRERYRVLKGNSYCNSSCQLDYEYRSGTRDKNEIIKKGRAVSHRKLKKDNWLNNPENRKKSIDIMRTPEMRERIGSKNRGKHNGMYGRSGTDCPAFKHGERKFDRYRHNRLRWDTIREAVFKRDSSKCVDCGSVENLQVHHIVPYFISRDDSLNNLILLCARCHMKHEPNQLTIKSIKRIDKKATTYNFSVEEDESYTAEDVIVHNCRCYIEGSMK